MKLKPYETEIKQMVDNGISAPKISDYLYFEHDVEVLACNINRFINKQKWVRKTTRGRRNR